MPSKDSTSTRFVAPHALRSTHRSAQNDGSLVGYVSHFESENYVLNPIGWHPCRIDTLGVAVIVRDVVAVCARRKSTR